MRKLQIATHNKSMHADEITAIALIKLFITDQINIHRVDHYTKNFDSYDFVIDIGKKFDGVKYFDHHQYKGGKSSAGLIWDYIKLQDKYPKISKLIKLVDDNDVGIQKAKEFEYSTLFKCFNASKLLSNEQDIQFEKAVDFAFNILKSMKEAQEKVNEAKKIVKNSYLFDNNKSVIELESFTSHWTTYINGIETPHIKAVVWEDEEEKNYKVKIPPKRIGSFELNGKAFNQDNSMEFVHSSGHFAIAKDIKILRKFLKNHFNK